jgi:hypothetical protein
LGGALVRSMSGVEAAMAGARVLLPLAKGELSRRKKKKGKAARRARLPRLEVARRAQVAAAVRDVTQTRRL